MKLNLKAQPTNSSFYSHVSGSEAYSQYISDTYYFELYLNSAI